MHILRQFHAPAFRDLQYRSQAFDDVDTSHGERDAAFGKEAGRVTAATEVFVDRRAPFGSGEASVSLLLRDFPVRLHRRVTFAVALFTGTVQRSRTGVDQMDDAVFCQSIQFMPRYTLNCFW
ncbi:hypothetical protein ExPUPEC79_04071 [Escherichia coli]|nr:hypothetical protein ExPUPEC79_04071 [Escherichia coli]